MEQEERKPFWETLHNPITMHKIFRENNNGFDKVSYDKKHYEKSKL